MSQYKRNVLMISIGQKRSRHVEEVSYWILFCDGKKLNTNSGSTQRVEIIILAVV